MTDIYTIDEVARHNNAKDLWIVIHGSIYDVTTFHKEHPGGEEVLLQLAGQDATECFESVGHSYEAINMRETFKVGELVDGTASSDKPKAMNTAEVKEPMEDEWEYQEAPKTDITSWSWMFLSIAFVIYAAIILFWYKKLTT